MTKAALTHCHGNSTTFFGAIFASREVLVSSSWIDLAAEGAFVMQRSHLQPNQKQPQSSLPAALIP
jgi:hypothetical protein